MRAFQRFCGYFASILRRKKSGGAQVGPLQHLCALRPSKPDRTRRVPDPLQPRPVDALRSAAGAGGAGEDGCVRAVVPGGEEGHGRGRGASHFPSVLSGPAAAGLERPPGSTVASPARRPTWPKERAAHLPGLPDIPEKYTCSLWHVACNFTPAELSPGR